jgi:pilus assembly protein CpaF
LFIVDVGSSNGTFVEELRLEANVETPLTPNQRVVIGNFIIYPQLDSVPGSTMKAPPGGSPVAASAAKAAEEAPLPRSRRKMSAALAQEYRLKKLIHDRLIERLDLRRKEIMALSDTDMRKRAQAVIEQILVDLRWEIPQGLNRDRLIQQVLDEALGLGPLEELLADDHCSEIMVNSFDMVYAERNGRLTLSDLRFSTEQAVLASIERILAPIGRRIDESSPMVDARLKDGSRVNAVIRPLALNGPCITIRKFAKEPLTIEKLVGFGSMSSGMAGFLRLAVENRLNIVISGGTGSGKTTLLFHLKLARRTLKERVRLPSATLCAMLSVCGPIGLSSVSVVALKH